MRQLILSLSLLLYHLPTLSLILHSLFLLQKELFVSKVEPTSPRNERKFSAATAPSMKTKWLKAFKSLKPAGSGSAQQADRWVCPHLYLSLSLFPLALPCPSISRLVIRIDVRLSAYKSDVCVFKPRQGSKSSALLPPPLSLHPPFLAYSAMANAENSRKMFPTAKSRYKWSAQNAAKRPPKPPKPSPFNMAKSR